MSDNNNTNRGNRETSPGSGGEGLASDIGLLSALLAASARNEQSEPGDGRQRISISIQQLLSYIARNGTGNIQTTTQDDDEEDGDYHPMEEDDDDDEEEDEDEEDQLHTVWGQRSFNSVAHYFPKVTTPQEPGLKLLYSGEFGPPPAGPMDNVEKPVQKPLSRRAARRAERSPVPPPSETIEAPAYPAHDTTFRIPEPNLRTPFVPYYYRAEAARGLVPNSPGAVVASYEDKAYSGQFSLDASFFYSCTQGHDIWVYDANSSGEKRTDPITGHKSRMKLLNRVKGVYGNWTVTDSHLSPDNERIVYSSISPVAHITKLHEPEAPHISLDFSGGGRRGNRRQYGLFDDHFGIWTCRFSADGKEVIACGSQKIFVWDLNAQCRTINILAHQDDVNSCCWADTASGNVLISGSDDSMVKVWDRRSLSSNRPSGVLPGHTEGVTSVSAKGDGRYIISNGKDHALRLWDLRMMRQEEDVDTHRSYGQPHYDYRYGNYRRPRRAAHPDDCSVMTFRGHAVFRTLIRCHFSPAETTGQAYVYSGSTDGRVYIWSLDGRIVETIDRSQTLPISFEPSEADQPPQPQRSYRHNDRIIRDCSWHPHEPVLLSCLWHSGESSSIGRHEWKSLGKRGMKLEDVVDQEREEASERRRESLFGL
ncbi:WD domain, G-beta repeat protein [Ceratobasidium sp. AG-Ba]|nr:WD domain, G-beta repeat protein [Ceratobasidium sp. AG-Ba]